MINLKHLPLRLIGWKVEGELPPDIEKYIAVCGKHTSNFDYPLMLAVIFSLDVRPHVLIKKEAFLPVLRTLLYKFGGIPVDRAEPDALFTRLQQKIKKTPGFVLVIAPEGTRSGDGTIKSGFYRISENAGIPIVPVTIHGDSKTVRLHQPLPPLAKEEAMAEVQRIFDTSSGMKNRSVT